MGSGVFFFWWGEGSMVRRRQSSKYMENFIGSEFIIGRGRPYGTDTISNWFSSLWHRREARKLFNSGCFFSPSDTR